jgi:predicted metalloenzyme YecM
MGIEHIVGLSDFLDRLFKLLGKYKLDLSKYNMDHVAYQASSSKDYQELLDKLLKFGHLIHDPIIEGRKVAMIKLSIPITYRNNTISALEIIEPKKDQKCLSGWEHAEFVINESYESIIKKYPDLKWDTTSISRPLWPHLKLRLDEAVQIKFHQMDIVSTIEKDINSSQV